VPAIVDLPYVPASEYAVAIIEDEATFRRALERLLRASGFEAHAFASAEDFLSSAGYASHACLILDIHLPGMSGFDLLDRLTASCQARPVVLITGQDQQDLRDRAARMSNCVYLRKPFLRTVLLEAVRSLVEPGGSNVD
jgi:two-component system, LuxR family, response regulator FixJ